MHAEVSQQATLAYWTPARLKSAKPVSVIAAGTAQSLKTTHSPTGKPSEVPGGAPLGGEQTAQGSSVSPSTTDPYDSFQVSIADTKLYPYELNGALFFTNDGSDYS